MTQSKRLAALAALGLLVCCAESGWTNQRRGGGGGGRSPSYRPQGAGGMNRSPSMSPASMQLPAPPTGGGRPGMAPGGSPGAGAARFPQPGPAGRPGNASTQRPRPETPPTNAHLNDFMGQQGGRGGGASATLPYPGNRPGAGDRPGAGGIRPGDRPGLGGDNRPGDRRDNNIRVGDVNIGNSADFSKDRNAWVNQRNVTGNNVRANAGNRYVNSYGDGAYRRNVAGGYPYYRGWGLRGPYYGWQAASWAGVGLWMGANLANTQPVYYGYGTGGNVYYENNTVYVNGQASGTPEEYAQQASTLASSAPPAGQVAQQEWMPLGAFALTRENVDDSQGMVELALTKQGVVAGTYTNEASGVSRSLRGKVDPKTQRLAVGFADGKDSEKVLETGLYNLSQEEAPGLLHLGTKESIPVLLVRLKPPA